jgi:hypothetical protein
MSTKDVLRKGVGLAVPLFGALYLAACGGTASFRGGESGGSSSAGASSGGTSNAGAPNSSGGESHICNVACPAIACASGATLVTQPGQCCPTCVASGGAGGSGQVCNVACPRSDCDVPGSIPIEGGCCPICVLPGDGLGGYNGTGGTPQPGGAGGALQAGGDAGIGGALQCGGVFCPAIACASGFVSVKEPGACCPTCVADAQACTAGEQGYQTLRASLLQQSGATSCNVDTDCTTLSGVPQCGDQCVTSAVNASLEPNMANQLSLWASSYCATCTPVYPPCVAPPTPFCSAGQCQLYHAL